jgi:1-acyl-sn-glycerol-3-phosphate acyltransferase
MIPIDRSGGSKSQAALDTAEQVLRRGELFGIFPEGTRSRDGRLRAAKPGTALLALRSGVPLVPAGIAGTERLRPPGERLVRRHPITIRFGESFTLGHQPSGRLDREALARGSEEITRQIAALLPESQQPAPEAFDADPS